MPGDRQPLDGPPPDRGRTAAHGWRTVELDPARSPRARPTWIRLDLGATAKAWVADRVRPRPRRARAAVCLSTSAATSPPPAAPRSAAGAFTSPTTIARARGPGQTVSILSGGLATSVVTTRRWTRERGGDAPHHRPCHAAPGTRPVAHRERRRRRLHGRQHRQHRRARPRRPRGALAERPRTARRASSPTTAPSHELAGWPAAPSSQATGHRRVTLASR